MCTRAICVEHTHTRTRERRADGRALTVSGRSVAVARAPYCRCHPPTGERARATHTPRPTPSPPYNNGYPPCRRPNLTGPRELSRNPAHILHLYATTTTRPYFGKMIIYKSRDYTRSDGSSSCRRTWRQQTTLTYYLNTVFTGVNVRVCKRNERIISIRHP